MLHLAIDWRRNPNYIKFGWHLTAPLNYDAQQIPFLWHTLYILQYKTHDTKNLQKYIWLQKPFQNVLYTLWTISKMVLSLNIDITIFYIHEPIFLFAALFACLLHQVWKSYFWCYILIIGFNENPFASIFRTMKKIQWFIWIIYSNGSLAPYMFH